MPPRSKFNLNKYVKYDVHSKKSMCLVDNCFKELCGKRPSNIRRHYKLVHKQYISANESDSSSYDENLSLKKRKRIKKRRRNSVNTEVKIEAGEKSNDTLPTTSKNIVSPRASGPTPSKNIKMAIEPSGVPKFTPSENENENTELDYEPSSGSGSNDVIKKTAEPVCSSLNITMDRKEFFKCCVGLVTVQNIPLRIFDDKDFFKKIIEPYEQLFDVDMNSKVIDLVVERAGHEIRENIAKRVKKKMISLKIDIATLRGRRILCLSIQYIHNYEVCMSTIGVIEVTKGYKPEFLEERILKCLCDINIDITQIYSVTILENENVLEDTKEEEEPIVNNDENNETLLQRFQTDIAAVIPVPVDRCVVEVLESTTHFVMKSIEMQLDLCQHMYCYLRTSGVDIPMLDRSYASNWNSALSMIKHLIAHKEFIDSLDDEWTDWNFVGDVITTFSPLADCYSKCFKSEQYLLGDFFRDWLSCELELEVEDDESNSYTSLLQVTMKNEKLMLFKNDTFISALYLDPRFNFTGSPFLTDDQKQAALQHLMKTYETLQQLEEEATEALRATSENDEYSRLEKHIAKMIKSESTSSTKTSLRHRLLSLCDRGKEPFSINVLDYWKKYHRLDRELTQLAEVALAVPASQISMERVFDAVSNVAGSNTKLIKETLANILFYKLNNDPQQCSYLDFVDD